MSVELSMLLAAGGVLALLHMAPRLYCRMLATAVATAGTPCGILPQTAWITRLESARKSFVEAYLIFALLVLATLILGLQSGQSAFGAQLFFIARIFHVLFSVLRDPVSRLGAAFTAHMGMLIIASGFIHSML